MLKTCNKPEKKNLNSNRRIVFIATYNNNVTEASVIKDLSSFGRIVQVTIQTRKLSILKRKNIMVQFRKGTSVSDLIKDKQQVQAKFGYYVDRYLSQEEILEKIESYKFLKIKVDYLPQEIDDQDLEQIFQDYGKIKFSVIQGNMITNSLKTGMVVFYEKKEYFNIIKKRFFKIPDQLFNQKTVTIQDHSNYCLTLKSKILAQQQLGIDFNELMIPPKGYISICPLNTLKSQECPILQDESTQSYPQQLYHHTKNPGTAIPRLLDEIQSTKSNLNSVLKQFVYENNNFYKIGSIEHKNQHKQEPGDMEIISQKIKNEKKMKPRSQNNIQPELPKNQFSALLDQNYQINKNDSTFHKKQLPNFCSMNGPKNNNLQTITYNDPKICDHLISDLNTVVNPNLVVVCNPMNSIVQNNKFLPFNQCFFEENLIQNTQNLNPQSNFITENGRELSVPAIGLQEVYYSIDQNQHMSYMELSEDKFPLILVQKGISKIIRRLNHHSSNIRYNKNLQV